MLIACTHCQRLVRRRDPRCPFCGAAVVVTPMREIPRLGRAAFLVAGAATISACASAPVAFYGSPIVPIDAEVEDAAPGFPDAAMPPDATTPDASVDAATDAHPDADAADAALGE